MEKDYRTDSYRVAVTPALPDDGRTSEGRPKSRRRRTPSKHGSRSTVDEDFEDVRQTIEMDEHKISLDALYSRFATDPNMGLSSTRAKEMYEVYGPNRSRTPLKVPEWVVFCKNLFGGYSIIMWVAAVLSLVVFSIQSDLMEEAPYENLVLGIILALIIFLTGIFSYYQERRGTQLMESLRTPQPQSVNIVREGKKMVLNAEELVMGDVITLKQGEKIPADIRIISSHNFKVDNALLNGVAEPQLRSPEFTHDDPLETMNMAYTSANAVEGYCRGIIVATGDRTLVSRLLTTVEMNYPESSLIKEVSFTVQTLTSLGISLGLLLFFLSFLAGFHWIDSLIFLVGITLAIVPEGLLAVVTISLILTSNRMRAKNCVVKNLDSIETLGRVSSILVDKNRSLTDGNLILSHMYLDGKMLNVDSTDDQSGGGQLYRNTGAYKALTRVAGLCNSASFEPGQESTPVFRRKATGDTIDSTLLRLVEISRGSVEELRVRNRKVCEIPFNASQRYQVTVHETEDPTDPSYVVLMKGAPEHLLDCCTTIIVGGKEVALDSNMKETVGNAFVDFGTLGETVIGFCDYKLPVQKFPPGYPFDAEDQNFPLTGMRLIGLLSFRDTIRPNVPDAVSKCRTGGVRVIMMTGDHPITAKALARLSGVFTEQSRTVEDIAVERRQPTSEILSSEANAIVIHGIDLKDMTHDRLDYLLRTNTDVVFARVTLAQKLQIVGALQMLGGIIAVTGSGVCDAPALRKAHLGIALARSGDDVAKDAGDILLLDDNFATIVAGIEEGRLIYENLRKSVAYILTSNMPEVWPFFLFLIFGIPLPLGAVTILVIDLGTDLLPAISLTYERPEYDIMTVNPRDEIKTRLLDMNVIDVRNGQVGMIEMVAGVFAYMVVMGENGFWLQDLLYRRRAWDSVGVSDMRDSYGQEWTYERRKYLEWTCHSAFFISIVICQWINLLCCKARNKLIFQQGCRNHVLTFAFIIETVLAILLLYIPGMGVGLRLMPIKINWWIPAIPYALVIICYDEMRRFLKIRFKDKLRKPQY